jgi:hypothetical protein
LADAAANYAAVTDKASIAWPLPHMPYGSSEFGVVDCNGYHLAFRQLSFLLCGLGAAAEDGAGSLLHRVVPGLPDPETDPNSKLNSVIVEATDHMVSSPAKAASWAIGIRCL